MASPGRSGLWLVLEWNGNFSLGLVAVEWTLFIVTRKDRLCA